MLEVIGEESLRALAWLGSESLDGSTKTAQSSAQQHHSSAKMMLISFLFLCFLSRCTAVHIAENPYYKVDSLSSSIVLPSLKHYSLIQPIIPVSSQHDSFHLHFSAYHQDFHFILEKNVNLFSPNYVEYLDNGEERSVLRTLSDVEQCYYQGHLAGNFNNKIALSYCGNKLEGIFDFNGEFYGIAASSKDFFLPVASTAVRQNQQSYSHLVYQFSALNQPPISLVDHAAPLPPSRANTSNNQQPGAVHPIVADFPTQNSPTQRRLLTSTQNVLQFYIYNDYARYNILNKNSTAVTSSTINIFNYLDSTWVKENSASVPLFPNIRAQISSQIIQSTTTYPYPYLPLSAQGEVSVDWLLGNFTKWVIGQPEMGNADNAVLLSGLDFQQSVVGYAYVGAICTIDATAIIQTSASATTSYADLSVAMILAHEVGHNLAMLHDGTSEPTCSQTNYIMSPSLCLGGGCPIAGTTHETYSNCSKKKWKTWAQTNNIACLAPPARSSSSSSSSAPKKSSSSSSSMLHKSSSSSSSSSSSTGSSSRASSSSYSSSSSSSSAVNTGVPSATSSGAPPGNNSAATSSTDNSMAFSVSLSSKPFLIAVFGGGGLLILVACALLYLYRRRLSQRGGKHNYKGEAVGNNRFEGNSELQAYRAGPSVQPYTINPLNQQAYYPNGY
jgi:hypothetical protein